MIDITVPGSMMLMGEYAVLRGYPCLVAALDKRMHVKLAPRHDKKIHIDSNLGHYHTTLEQLAIVPPFQFILGTLAQYTKQLPCGCDIEISTEFSSAIGFGSSAAVTVATVLAVRQWLGLDTHLDAVFQCALTVLHAVQGRGSGADIAASTYGGVLQYHSPTDDSASIIVPLANAAQLLPLVMVYSGYKTPTVQAIDRFEQQWQQAPQKLRKIIAAIGAQVTLAVTALQQQQQQPLLQAIEANQQLMTALGVNDAILQAIITALKHDTGIMAAKISGSGLGDCVFGLGQLQQQVDWHNIDEKVRCVTAKITTHGVRSE